MNNIYQNNPTLVFHSQFPKLLIAVQVFLESRCEFKIIRIDKEKHSDFDGNGALHMLPISDKFYTDERFRLIAEANCFAMVWLVGQASI